VNSLIEFAANINFGENKMALNFAKIARQAGSAVYNLPSSIAVGISTLFVGNPEYQGKTGFLNGFLSLGIVGSLYLAVRSVSSFLNNNRNAINLAFWVALGFAAAVAVAGAVMALWFPAALAAVTGFSIYGISIAAIAGANVVAQVAVASGLVAGAAAALTFAGTALVNLVTWGINKFKTKAPEAPKDAGQEEGDDLDNDNGQGKDAGKDQEPVVMPNPLAAPTTAATPKGPAIEPIEPAAAKATI
jgi:hypothetical protein